MVCRPLNDKFPKVSDNLIMQLELSTDTDFDLNSDGTFWQDASLVLEIMLFIFVIVYCYCKRNKTSSSLPSFFHGFSPPLSAEVNCNPSLYGSLYYNRRQ